MSSKEALFQNLFRRRVEPSPTAQGLYETFLKAYNPEKNRFKDKGWQEKFKKQVAEHAEELKQELEKHRAEKEGMMGQFWRAIKRGLPLEVIYQRTSVASVLRSLATTLTASGGVVFAPREVKFEKHIIPQGHRVRWEGRDFGGQYRVVFKTDNGRPMGYLVYDSSKEFEDEWNVRTSACLLSDRRDGFSWGDYLEIRDNQCRDAIHLAEVKRTHFVEDDYSDFDLRLINTWNRKTPLLVMAKRMVDDAFLDSNAQSIYMSYALSPDGKAHYRKVLKKFPGYNTDRKEAERAVDEIMKNLRFRVRGPAENLDAVLERVRRKVLDGIL